jgi:broad specificity phosphatase PhoE
MLTQAAAAVRLCLIRHGQGSLGTNDYDRLSELGKRQGAMLGERIRIDYGDACQVWSGSLKRHRQTLELIAPQRSGLIDDALNEYTVSELVRSAVAQADSLDLALPDDGAFADPKAYLATFLAWFPDVLEAWQSQSLRCVHNGSWPDFQRRVLSPVERWQRELAGGRSAVVVTSAGVISTIVASLLERDLDWQRQLNVALYNASITELAVDRSGRWQALRINCIEHLPDEQLKTLA